MCPHVYIESILSRVLLAANLTFEWLVARMDELVSFKVTLGDELFPTTGIIAHKWPVPRLYIFNEKLSRR